MALDAATRAQVEADLRAQVEGAKPATPNRVKATGRCHTCDKAVSGERRYCGKCLAKRKV